MDDDKLERIMDKMEKLSQDDRAIVAGCILDSIAIDRDRAKLIWDQLSETTREELGTYIMNDPS